MSLLNVITKNVTSFVTNHSSEILIGLGIAGFAGTTVLTVKATDKARELLKQRKEELQVEKLPAGEIVKTVYKPYALPALTFVTSAACIIGASNIYIRKNAALMSAYKLSESAFAEYRTKAKDLLGAEKATELHKESVEAAIQKDPRLIKAKEMLITGPEVELFHDKTTGTYFESTEKDIQEACDTIWERLRGGSWSEASYNDLYSELSLDTTIAGESIGWNEYCDRIIPYYVPGIAPNGKLCKDLYFETPPKSYFKR